MQPVKIKLIFQIKRQHLSGVTYHCILETHDVPSSYFVLQMLPNHYKMCLRSMALLLFGSEMNSTGLLQLPVHYVLIVILEIFDYLLIC